MTAPYSLGTKMLVHSSDLTMIWLFILICIVFQSWRLWSDGRPLELIDEAQGDSIFSEEAIRCIHIGLLCVQERAEDRPDMSSVVLMLNGERPMPKPRQPGFYPHHETSSPGKSVFSSSNEISISLLQAR